MAKETILIVEDSPTELRGMVSVLEKQGYRVLTATDGEQAVALAASAHPQLVLLDVVLPKKNGFQVCRQLKAAEETRDVKVIIVSSKTQDSDRFWGLKQGAEDYITKPFSERDLLAAVARHL